MNFGTGMGYLLKSIAALVLIIYLANLLLRYLNGLSSKKTQSLQVIERLPLSKTSSLCIVKVVETYYLMSFTEGKNELLKTLSEAEIRVIEQLQEEKKETAVPEQFEGMIKALLEQKQSHAEKRQKRG